VAIVESAHHNLVGGAAAVQRNVISGNGNWGVRTSFQAHHNTVIGNYLGVDATGAAGLGNNWRGVNIGGVGNVVGGLNPGERNVISGNRLGGAQLSGGAVLLGNYIGTNAAGDAAIGNGSWGVLASEGVGFRIEGNLISGTFKNGGIYAVPADGPGVYVIFASDVQIVGNRIGTNAAGNAALPNDGHGIYVYYSEATIEDNLISGNAENGVTVVNNGVPHFPNPELSVFFDWWRADGNADSIRWGDRFAQLLGGTGFTDGVSGQAFSLDGVDDLVVTQFSGFDYSLRGASFEAWVRTTDADGAIVADGGGDSAQVGTGLFVENGALVFRGAKGTPGEFNFVLTGPAINDGVFHHVAGAWTGDATPGGVSLYLDGVKVATDAALSTVGRTTATLQFGGHSELAYPFLSGALDEVAWHFGVLSEEQVATIYSLGGGRKGGTGALLTGNLIGVDVSGDLALPNAGHGVLLDDSAFNTIGAAGGMIDESQTNRIAWNGMHGVNVIDARSAGNAIRGNSIHSNGMLGISLGAPGVAENDPLDADTGPNQLQNHPVLFVAAAGMHTRVAGTLHSRPGAAYLVDFYANSTIDASGHGEGERYLGSITVVTDAQGNSSFDWMLPAATAPTEWITATATHADFGDTSEFSQALLADDSPLTYVVTNTRDSGAGSLRAAIEFVNNLPPELLAEGDPQIVFQIPTSDPNFIDVDAALPGGDPDPDAFLIAPLTALPPLTRGRTQISGQSQTDFTGDTNPFGPEIILDGNQAGGGADGLRLASSENFVHALNIQRFGGSGIFITSNGNQISGSYLGTDATGRLDRGNAADGIRVQGAANNLIGGTAPGAGNLISGNGGFGIWLRGQASNNTVQGNYLGTDIIGETAIGNFFGGVGIWGGSGNLIGGTAPGAGNVISGNDNPGIILQSGTGYYDSRRTADNRIQGNLIGLNATGNAALGNVLGGIVLQSGSGNVIGGPEPGARNVIAGSILDSRFPDAPMNGAGVVVWGSGTDNVVEGNYVGVDATGTFALPNAGHGIAVRLSAAEVRNNLIAGNLGDGIHVRGNNTPDKLVGFWRAEGNDEDDLFVIADAGELLGGVGFAPGVAGQAFSFDGADDFFQDNKTFRLNYGGGKSMEAWVRTADTQGTLITDGGGIDAERGMGLFVENGRLVVRGSKGTAGEFNFTLTGPVINDDQFHHVAVTWTGDASANGVKLYIDGTLAAAGTALAAISTASTFLHFGGHATLPLPFLNGLLDEIAVYDEVLSAEQIETIHRLGGAAKTEEMTTIAENRIGGAAALGNRNGVVLDASWRATVGGHTFTRNDIVGNTQHGVLIAGPASTENVVSGNYIDANQKDGVRVEDSAGNIIGGPTPGAGNVISDNQGRGLVLLLGGRNVVQGNRIGTDVSGTAAAPNNGWGVYVAGSAENLIGGTAPGAGNLVSGNRLGGIAVFGAGAIGNRIQGNRIGTDITGAVALANTLNSGIHTGDASGFESDLGVTGFATQTLIGGEAPGAGNVISANGQMGVWIRGEGATGNVVQQNLIGTDLSGTVALGNRFPGIWIDRASANLIGGLTAAVRNVVSGNDQAGIYISGETGTNNVVQGNYIGTDAAGMQDLGNSLAGIMVDSSHNQIGGDVPGAGNVISGSDQVGVWIRGRDPGGTVISGFRGGDVTQGNVVQGNLIGLNAAGSATIPNTLQGVALTHARESLIGGLSASARNVISGNGQNGIVILGAGADGNIVQGNFIGTDITGTIDLGNSGDGIHLADGSGFTPAAPGFPKNTLIGGANSGAGNLISGNQGAGIRIVGGETLGHVIQGNSIGTDRDGDAAIPNDNGVLLEDAIGVLIGGTENGARNLISGNTGAGISIAGGSNHVIQGNYIGTTADGMAALRNLGQGVKISDSPANVIGGSAAGAGNVIGGSAANIEIRGAAAADNVIQGNFIGVSRDDDGALAPSISERGILIADGASRTTIGGAAPGAGNVIAGHFGNAIEIFGGGQNLIAGNKLGTNAAGNAKIGNLRGVRIVDSPDNHLLGNLISGNSVGGILVEGAASSGLVVRGNLIGTDWTGTQTLPNTIVGLSMIDADSATIGGPAATDRNVIAGNQTGLHLSGGSGHVVMGNYIGVDVTGARLLGGGIGIDVVNSANVQIGGAANGEGNLISGNSFGIHVRGASAGARIQGNKIGTDAAGLNAVPNGVGLFLDGVSGAVVGGAGGAGNLISGNSGHGVSIRGGGGHTLQGNSIGVDATGAGVLRNTTGVRVENSAANRIGGSTPGAGNVIASNVFNIRITGEEAADNVIQGNLIGVDATGAALVEPLPSGPNANENGIQIENGAHDNTIGGPEPGAGNVISGHREAGVAILGGGQNVIEGNKLGTNAAGSAAIANGRGVHVENSPDNRILNNLISGNFGGVGAQGALSTNLVIQGNWIGVDAGGAGSLPNQQWGILLSGVPGARIGGTSPNARNVISGAGDYGIDIRGGSSATVVQGNYIGTTADGRSPLSHVRAGILMSDDVGTLIGGAAPGAGNVIFSTASAIAVGNPTTVSRGGQIVGNRIGTTPDGAAAIGSGGLGIVVSGTGTARIEDLVIGGAAAGAGNVISGNSKAIVVAGEGVQGLRIQGNRIGTDLGGAKAIPNSEGISLQNAAGVTIGGVLVAARNLISGNNGAGISIVGGSGHVVQGNLIGTNSQGDAPLPNQEGIVIQNASGVLIGGLTAGARNIISGNAGHGVRIDGASSSQNVVQGNFIGLNATGTGDLGNGGSGVMIIGASETTIGGATAAARNVISGNDSGGIHVHSGEGTTIRSNYIGLNANGTAAVGNSGSGVAIQTNGAGTLIRDNVISGNLANGADQGYGIQSAPAATIRGNLIGLNAAGNAAVSNAGYGVIASGVIGGATAADRNVISGNSQGGIRAAAGALVQGNYIGTDISGLTSLGNGGIGISVEGPDVVIGGLTPAPGTGAGNVISGNLLAGIVNPWAGGANLVVRGNLIGLGADGVTDLGNGGDGVRIGDASGNRIGGDAPGARNVISGNDGAGLRIIGGSPGHVVQGNYIGTDLAGSRAISNVTGVLLENASGALVGGTAEAARNIISGNSVAGVSIVGGSNHTVQGNWIGLDASGAFDLGNALSGVEIRDGSTGNLVGGPTAAARNVIGGNDVVNVSLHGAATSGNTIQGNYIGTNAAGTADIGSDDNLGLSIDSSSGNRILGNVISGAGRHGVLIADSLNLPGPMNNRVQGNRIGTNAAGTAAIGNLQSGVFVSAGADGNFLGTDSDGAGDTAEGNLISGNHQTALHVDSNDNLIAGNIIGLNAAGAAALNNLEEGIVVSGASNTVGGLTLAARNLISGNAGDGIAIVGGSSNTLRGNLIGVTADGTATPGNGGYGVRIDSSPNNVVGPGNVISGNALGGAAIQGAAAAGNSMSGNLIRFNAADGIRITGAPGVLIGGPLSEDRNIISGNQGNGVALEETAGAVVRRNYIGLAADGATPLGNGGGGVRLENSTGAIIADNVISGNEGSGIALAGPTNANNVIEGNRLGTDASGVRAIGNALGIHVIQGAGIGIRSNLISGNESAGIVLGAGARESFIEGNLIGTDHTGNARLIGGDVQSAGITILGRNMTVRGNVISGNAEGVRVEGAAAIGLTLQGNRIGTNLEGTGELPNALFGINIIGAQGALIGGLAESERNVISGNRAAGIRLEGGSNHQILGNFIGTDINGEFAVPNALGLLVRDSARTRIIGNLISGNNGSGIDAQGAATTGLVIQRNLVGVNVSGQQSLSNLAEGILLSDVPGAEIGGLLLADRNVISGNLGTGISLHAASGAVIRSNYIGLAADGAKPLGNGDDGVRLESSSNASVTDNVISANGSDGVRIEGGQNHTVQGNYLGATADGGNPRGNAGSGAVFQQTTGGLIADNLSSSNSAYGVFLVDASATVVTGNLLGVNATGSVALPNSTGLGIQNGENLRIEGNTIAGNLAEGMIVESGASGNQIIANHIGVSRDGVVLPNGGPGILLRGGASDNLIGGLEDGLANTIAFHDRAGVEVVGDATRRNTIRGNLFFETAGLAIDLGGDGVTVNDAGDLDTGPNQFQNFPEILLAAGGAETFLFGTLSSRPETTYLLDFYATPPDAASGEGELRRFLGFLEVRTNALGVATFKERLAVATSKGERIVATATDLEGNTSEFSPFKLVAVDTAEPNNRPEQATDLGLLSSRDAVLIHSGIIAPPDDVDFVRFTVIDSIAVELQTFADREGSTLDTVLTLLDAAGNTLDFNDDFSGKDSLIRRRLERGVYFARVEGFQGTVGEYRLEIRNRDFVGPQVLRMTPSATVAASPQQIELQLDNNDLDPATLTTAAFQLWQVDSQSQRLADRSDRLVGPVYDAQADRITLALSAPLPSGRYQLTVRDSLANLAGLPLDGDRRDGPGGDFVATFAVDAQAPSGTLTLSGAAGSAAEGVFYRFTGVVTDGFPAVKDEVIRIELDLDGDGFDDGVATVALSDDLNASYTLTAATALAPGQGRRTALARFIDARGNVSPPLQLTLNTDLPVVTAADFRDDRLLVHFNFADVSGADQASSYAVEGRRITQVQFDAATATAALTLEGGLPDGAYSLTVFSGALGIRRAGLALDGDGDGQPGGDFQAIVVVDRIAPTLMSVRLAAGSDTGVAGDNITSDARPAFEILVADVFPGAAGSVTVSLDVDGDGFDDGSAAAQLVNSEPVTVTVAATRPILSSGSVPIGIRIVDGSGNARTSVFTVEVDRVRPRVTSSQAEVIRDSSDRPVGIRYAFQFSEDLDPNRAASPENFTLFAAGGNRIFYDGNDIDRTSAIESIDYQPAADGTPARLIVTALLAGDPLTLPDDEYELTLLGHRIVDIAGNSLLAGDYRHRFQLQVTELPPVVESAFLLSATVGEPPNLALVQFRDAFGVRGAGGALLRDGDHVVNFVLPGAAATVVGRQPNLHPHGPVLQSAAIREGAAGRELVLQFDGALDAEEAARATNYLLVTPGANGILGDADDRWITLAAQAVAYDAASRQVVLSLGDLPGGAYQLRIDGTGDADLNEDAVRDLGNYRLERLDPDGRVVQELTIGKLHYNALGDRVILSEFGALKPGVYRLTVAAHESSGASGIGNALGVLLDGDDDGVAGGTFIREFLVLPPSLSTALDADALARNHQALDALVRQSSQQQLLGRKAIAEAAFGERLLEQVDLVSVSPGAASEEIARAVDRAVTELFEERLAELPFVPDEYLIFWGRDVRFLLRQTSDDPNLPDHQRSQIGFRLDGLRLDDLIPGALLVSLGAPESDAAPPLSLAIVPIDPGESLASDVSVLRESASIAFAHFGFIVELEGLAAGNQAGVVYVSSEGVVASQFFLDLAVGETAETPLTLPPQITGIDPIVAEIDREVLKEVREVTAARDLLVLWLDPADYVLRDLQAGGRVEGVGAIAANTFPGSYYSGNGFTELLVIPNALSGPYSLTLIGLGESYRGAIHVTSGDYRANLLFQGRLGEGAAVTYTLGSSSRAEPPDVRLFPAISTAAAETRTAVKVVSASANVAGRADRAVRNVSLTVRDEATIQTSTSRSERQQILTSLARVARQIGQSLAGSLTAVGSAASVLAQAVPLDWQSAGDFVSNMASRLMQLLSGLWNPPDGEAPVAIDPFGQSEGPASPPQTASADAAAGIERSGAVAPPDSQNQIARSNHVGLFTILATAVAGAAAVRRRRPSLRRRAQRNR
jgi:parallel beta-helix repeat protein